MNALWIALFSVCLIPLSSEDGFSVNYLFLVIPSFMLLWRCRLSTPETWVVACLFVYVFIFLTAAVFQNSQQDLFSRRLISFILFISIFAFIFVSPSSFIVNRFKAALVVFSGLHTLYVVNAFASLGGAALGDSAKDLIGSQRIGFLYLMAFWILLAPGVSLRIHAAIRYPTLLLIVFGLFLTFSRSSIIGLVGGLALFFLWQFVRWLRDPVVSFRFAGRAALCFGCMALMVLVLAAVLPSAFSFFEQRLLNYLGDSDTMNEDLSNPDSSGGTRIYIMGRVVQYALENPLTGSGFLGIWTLQDNIGSAHIQYLDVMFRTGILGFVAFVLLLAMTMYRLAVKDQPIFWGMVSVLIYGLFHETFKESQGAFLLSFVMGYALVGFSRPRVGTIVRRGGERGIEINYEREKV